MDTLDIKRSKLVNGSTARESNAAIDETSLNGGSSEERESPSTASNGVNRAARDNSSDSTISGDENEGRNAGEDEFEEDSSDVGTTMEDDEDSRFKFKPSPVPEEVEEAIDHLRMMYVQRYCPAEACPWFQFSGKPDVGVYVECHIRERRRNSLFRNDPVPLSDFMPAQGERCYLLGPPGSGKSVFTRRLAYQYGLGLVSHAAWDILILLDVEVALGHQDLLQYLCSELRNTEESCRAIEEWMEDHPSRVLFLVDMSVSHEIPNQHFAAHILRGESFGGSTVLVASGGRVRFTEDGKPGAVLDLERIFDLVPWSDADTLAYLRDFASVFTDANGDRRAAFLECFEGLSCHRLMERPRHAALLCLLYVLNLDALCERPPETLTDLYNLLFLLLLQRYSPEPNIADAVKMTENHWQNAVSNSPPEKATAADMDIYLYDFSAFLAAKHVALRYLCAAQGEQIGLDGILETKQMLRRCWDFDESGRHRLGSARVPVFLSRLLRFELGAVGEALGEMLGGMNSGGRRQCLRVAEEAGRECGEGGGAGEVLKVAMNRATQWVKDDTEDVAGTRDSMDTQPVSTLRLCETAPAAPSDVDTFTRRLGEALYNSDGLKELEIDFTALDPLRPGAHCQDSFMPADADWAPLWAVVEAATGASNTLQSLRIIAKLGSVSPETMECAAALLDGLSSSSTLQHLSVSLNTQLSACTDLPAALDPVSEPGCGGKILVDAINSLLAGASGLNSLELEGCFLHEEVLPRLQDALEGNSELRFLHISGQPPQSGPIHRSATTSLTSLLRLKPWEEVSLDLLHFAGLSEGRERFPRPSYWSRQTFDEVDSLLAQGLLALTGHSTLEKLQIRARRCHSSVMERLADCVETCETLQHLKVESEEPFEEQSLLSVCCGLICTSQLTDLILVGQITTVKSTLNKGARGAALMGLIQACRHSTSLSSVQLVGQRLDIEDVHWLTNAVPDLAPGPDTTRLLSTTLQGKVEVVDEKAGEKKVDKLRNCQMPDGLVLKVNLEVEMMDLR